jgi:hypothetical protein
MRENQKIMAPKTSGSRKLKRKSLPKFEADLYSKIPSDGLIVFAVHYLIEHKIEVNLEDIVSLCFLLFPHKFGLKKYPRWPDSAPINRHWGDVRRKRYVTANDYLGYRLTTKGIRLVRRVAKVLGVKLPKPIKKIQPIQVKKAAPISEPVKQLQKPEVKAQPVQEEKIIAPAPVKKAPSVQVKKSAPAPVKQVQKPEIKAQPIQKEKATPPEPVKKIRPVRIKKVSPAPAKQAQPVIPIAQAKKAPPVQEEKAVPSEPVNKIHPVQVKKVSPASEPVKQAQKPEIKAQPVQKEKAIAPVKMVRPVRAEKVVPVPAPVMQAQKSEIKAQPVQKEKAIAPVKKIRSVRKKKVSLVPAKQIQKPEIKAQPIQEEKATQLELIKTHPVPTKKAPSTLEKKAQAAPISKPIQPVKIPTQVKETKPAKPVIIQPVKVEKVQAEPVSREAKERAGKFTRMMERSDAYIHYKKNGSKSNISEFDFRSLLLCTMESSAETLARNVELFKGYAGIHHRQDLITFLIFCEDKFSYLLKPARKVKK